MILALQHIPRDNEEMPSVFCPECELRVNPRKGACPSCGSTIETRSENRESPPKPREWFSAKAIHRKQIWPVSFLIFGSALCLFFMMGAALLRSPALVPFVGASAIGFTTFLLAGLSYLWYIRVIISVREDEEGNYFLHLQKPGGKNQKIAFPLTPIHSWWNHRQPVMALGHLVRIRKPVLSLALQDEDGKTLLAFEEEVGKAIPIPADWPEEERRYEKEITYDCFPFPRFNLPLLKNTLEKIPSIQDQS